MVRSGELSAYITGYGFGGFADHFHYLACAFPFERGGWQTQADRGDFGFSGVLFLINPFAEQTGTLSLIGIIAGLAMPFFAALMFIFLRRPGQSKRLFPATPVV